MATAVDTVAAFHTKRASVFGVGKGTVWFARALRESLSSFRDQFGTDERIDFACGEIIRALDQALIVRMGSELILNSAESLGGALASWARTCLHESGLPVIPDGEIPELQAMLEIETYSDW